MPKWPSFSSSSQRSVAKLATVYQITVANRATARFDASLVGIELRRAGCRWGVTKPALSIASWDLISTMATFSEAPL
jgi:hypothetical protein